MKQVSITGGGLAGLSLGIALRKHGVPVVLTEAGTYPRHRVCGEFITGIEAQAFDRLGIAPCLESSLHLSSVAIYSDNAPVLRRNLPRPAWGISRWQLDHALARLFKELGGELRTGVRMNSNPEDGEGRVLATGRVPGKKKRQWIGLKLHLEQADPVIDLELHLGRAGYAGISRIGEGRVNLCGLFRQIPGINLSGPYLMREYLLRNGLHELARVLARAMVDHSSFCAVSALDYGLLRIPEKGFRLGDSWSLIPPFTGNGMSLAFESALVALNPLVSWAEGSLDWDLAISQYRSGISRQALGRIVRARLIHGILLFRATRSILAWLARRDALPFGMIYALTH